MSFSIVICVLVVCKMQRRPTLFIPVYLLSMLVNAKESGRELLGVLEQSYFFFFIHKVIKVVMTLGAVH